MSEKLKSELEKKHIQIHFLEQQLKKYFDVDTRIPQTTSSEIDDDMKLSVERTYQCDTKTKMRLLCKIEV